MGIEPEYPEVPEHPEIPFPLPPERTPPRRTEPLMVPVVTVGDGDAWERLADQRRILVSGRLDQQAVTELSAKLMAFDGESSRDVELVINSPGGPLADVFAVLDVLDLMRAKVNATVIGSAHGTAVAVVAGATGERRAAPNAVLALRIDEQGELEGSSSEIGRELAALDALRARYVARLAAVTALDEEQLAAEIDRGGFLTPAQAVYVGMLDTVIEA